MSGKTELFVFLTAAIATIVGLVTAQEFFLSYQDILAHRAIDEAPASAELTAIRKAESDALQTARMPIDDAKRALAERGRAAFPDIAAAASEDYSALSGWVHQRNFKPFVAPPAPSVVPTVAVDPNAPADAPSTVPAAPQPTAQGAH